MDKQGEIQSAVFCEQSPEVECFVEHFTYYRSLRDEPPPTEDSDFWYEVSTAFFRSAILAWCNVFGSCRSDLHWSKLIENMPEKVKEDFTNGIRKSTDLNKESCKKLQDDMKTLRDKRVAHRDLNWQQHIWNSPDFENVLKIAIEYECWVNELLQKEGSSPMNSLTDIIKSAEGEVKHVIALLSSLKRQIELFVN